MNGNISKKKGLASSVDADSLNYISEKVSEKLIGYTDAVASEEAARTEADKALESEILKKQDKLTFDTAPTAESENPVTSGGIKDELDKKVDKADGMGLSKIKDISLEKMTIASSPGGVLAKCEMLDIETQSGEKISASYVPHTHLTGFDHPDKCVTKRKLSDELQAEMNKISTKADKSDTYTKTEVDNKVSSAQKSCVKNTDYATTSKAGIVKIGDGLKVSSGLVSIDPATENDVKQNMDSHKPFAPSNIELLLKLVTTDTINSNNDLAPTSQAVKAALSLYATKEDTDAEFSEVNKTLALKINKYDIVDALMNTSPDKVLSANQGAVLKGLIADKADKSDTYTKDEINSKISGVYRICGSKTIDEINNLKYQIGVESELKIGDVYNCSDSGNVKAKIGFAGMQLSFDQYLGNTASVFNLIYPDNLGEIGFIPTPSYVAVIMSGTTSYKIVNTPTAASTSIVFEGNVLKPDGSQYANGDTVWFDTFLDSIGIPVNAGDNIVWTENGWDKLAATVDLSSYVKNTDYADSVKGGVVKISHPGTSYLSMYEGSLSVDVSEILSQYKIEQIIVGDSAPTTSTFISKQGAIDEGLLYFDKTNKNAYILTQVGHGDEPGTYVYEWKKVILEDDLSDYVKNTSYASATTGGVVRIAGFGLAIGASGVLSINAAKNTDIDARKSSFAPIVPTNLDYAVRAVSYNAITASTDEALLLGHRTETRLTSADVTALTLTTPAIPTDYECSFAFKSGAAATTLTYSSTPIIWKGADCDSDGDFIPMPNTIYEVSIKRIGTDSSNNPIVVARVGVC